MLLRSPIPPTAHGGSTAAVEKPWAGASASMVTSSRMIMVWTVCAQPKSSAPHNETEPGSNLPRTPPHVTNADKTFWDESKHKATHHCLIVPAHAGFPMQKSQRTTNHTFIAMHARGVWPNCAGRAAECRRRRRTASRASRERAHTRCHAPAETCNLAPDPTTLGRHTRAAMALAAPPLARQTGTHD